MMYQRKKYMYLFAALMVLSLSGCRQNVIEPQSSNPLESSTISVLSSSDSSTSSSVAVDSVLSPSLTADPTEVLDPALEAYGWFMLAQLDADPERPKVVQDESTGEEKTWYPVTDQRFQTYADLDAYLRNLFSDEIADELLGYGYYQEFDGQLYDFLGGRGANIFIDHVEYQTVSVTDTQAKYTVSVYYTEDSGEPENPKVLEFICTKVNGKWVFTQFPYYL